MTIKRLIELIELIKLIESIKMVSPDIVWKKIWPTVEQLIRGVLEEDTAAVEAALHPKGSAWRLYDLFDRYVFELILKTVLGRQNLSVTRAIESDEGKTVYLELVWPEPGLADGSYTAADLVSVKLRKYRRKWLVMDINPAAVDLPLTEARAAAILANSKALNPDGELPREPWLLPVALYGGALQITLREEGQRDDVERVFLSGMQNRGYGLLSLLGAHRLWRDFLNTGAGDLDPPEPWAAAVEFIASEQAMREMTQAAVAKHYDLGVTAIAGRVGHIKKRLNIRGLDERYTAVQREQIVFQK